MTSQTFNSAASGELRRRAWRASMLFVAAMWIVLFLPAFTLDYWQAWVFWLAYSAASIAGTHYFLKHDPKLLERRLSVGPAAEREPTQKVIMTFASICFVLVLVIPGLDHHWHWSHVPTWLVLVGDAGVIVSYVAIFWVVRVNSYAAATIRVEQDQPIISTGPYAFVRHPMYTGALAMFAALPLALGSYWGMLMAIPALAGLVWRLLDEERVLKRDLPGYAEYCERVHYRLIPGVW